ncbi:rhomboid family intramembrane serine protease [Xanthobacter autotrophicus DSM 431]|uniref:rhomboid family intramembrane serine protease n=1 Tax=Xanthobacter nonsaccharivorans TaxID=3119912 RepID=UPI003727C5BE
MRGQRQGFFEQPHAATYLLIAVNVAVFGMMVLRTGAAAPGGRDLWQAGAIYPLALQRGEYWRLLAYGFLHANPLHLLTNMFCLALWGGHLERRVGATYFIIIYGLALVAGGLVSLSTHKELFLSVGASGAVSGVLGALFSLWILGKVGLSASFFVINIGLNIALSLSTRGIDWGAHLGGFTAGLLACAVIDLLERGNARLLTCKFPEPLKLNLLILAIAAPLAVAPVLPPVSYTPAGLALPAAIFVLALVVVAKAVDLLLSLRHGLAFAAAVLALGNAAAVLAIGDRFDGSACAASSGIPALSALCAHPGLLPALGGGLAFAVSLALSAGSIGKGIADIGFIAPALRGERRRRGGL